MSTQKGMALVLALLGLLGAATGMAWAWARWAEGQAAQRDRETAAALMRAREALIHYAAQAATPGQMPCPEDLVAVGSATEGQAAASCSGTKVVVGRLPWRTLQLGDLRDGLGDRLWYILGPGFRNAPLNSQNTPALTVDGTPAVAVVLSPGWASPGQARSGIAPLRVADYLDGANASGGLAYTQAVNDRLLVVRLAHWAEPLERRVLSDVVRALWVHYCGAENALPAGGCLSPQGGARAFPPPAAVSDTACLGTASILASTGKCPASDDVTLGRIPANPSPLWTTQDALSPLRGQTGSAGDWFQKNGWRELIFYGVAPGCGNGVAGCGSAGWATQDAQGRWVTGLRGVVIAAGPTLAGQTRTTTARKTNAAQYLEGSNLTGSTGRFVSGAGVSLNDRVRGWP